MACLLKPVAHRQKANPSCCPEGEGKKNESSFCFSSSHCQHDDKAHKGQLATDALNKTNKHSKKNLLSENQHLHHLSLSPGHLYKASLQRVEQNEGNKVLKHAIRISVKKNYLFILYLNCCVTTRISLGLSVQNSTALKMEILGFSPHGSLQDMIWAGILSQEAAF